MSDDLISRQAAIAKLFNELDQQELYLPIHFKNFVLDELPSIRQKTGQWLINSDGYYPYCSECMNEPQNRIMTDYCPNCGAYMKGESNGQTTSN